jgi:hypothetical protein
VEAELPSGGTFVSPVRFLTEEYAEGAASLLVSAGLATAARHRRAPG